MNGHLHIVKPEESARANAIDLWLASYNSESGRRSMKSTLRAIVRATLEIDSNKPVRIESFPWEALADSQFFGAVVQMVEERYTKRRSPKYIIAMRALLQSLVQSGMVDYWAVAETLAKNKVRSIAEDLPPLAFTTEDLWRILLRCRQDNSPLKGSRDLALISMGLSTGARRAELTRIDVSDVSSCDRTVRLLVKGGGRRTASLHSATVEHLEHWLKIRGTHEGPLFPTLRKGGHIGEGHLSEHQFWKILVQRSGEADISPAVSPHDLRRWYVSSLLDNGVDVFQVARSVGHRRVDTTFRYDRRSQDRLRMVIDGLEIPGLAHLDHPESP